MGCGCVTSMARDAADPRVDAAPHLTRHLTVSTMNQAAVEMKYAVRGEVVAKAGELKARLQKGEKLPFEYMVPCNIGNPHAVKQKPITFYRQIGAACMCPSLLETSDFPEDVKARAREYLAATGESGIGSYSVRLHRTPRWLPCLHR